MTRCLSFALFVISCTVQDASGSTWRVDASATGANTGTNWTDAFIDLQTAFNTAVSGDEIWVAAGTYRPSLLDAPDDPRSATFRSPGGVAVYGGFAGIETSRDERDWTTRQTILSGDLLGNDGEAEGKSDNAYHVITHQTAGPLTTIDGITVSGGWNEIKWLDGAGIYQMLGAMRIVNCTFLGNRTRHAGGAIYSEGYSPVTVSNCTFIGNSAFEFGGAIFAWCKLTVVDCLFDGNVANSGGAMYFGTDTGGCTVTRCRFLRNRATFLYGGAMCIHNCSGPLLASIIECVFEGNITKAEGGAIMCYNDATLHIRDCTFNNNTCTELTVSGGGAIMHKGTLLTLTNCSFSGNSAFRGGALNNMSLAARIANCRFHGNHARDEGSAVSNRGSSAKYLNCVMSGNTGDAGVGAFVGDSTVDFFNCTLGGNQTDGPDGAAITIKQETGTSAVHIANSILWGNTGTETSGQDAQIRVVDGTLSVEWSCVEGWTGALGGPGNTGADPLFSPDGLFTYLLPASPCIDGGSNTALPADFNDLDGDGNTLEAVPVDIDSSPRLTNMPTAPDTGQGSPAIVDMGAVEYIEDCNRNGVFDACELDCGQPGGPCDVAGCGTAQDCNLNSLPDSCEPDNDSDGIIDACDEDDDNDGVPDTSDNCPFAENTGQENGDADALGDACDSCPGTIAGVPVDSNGCSPVYPADMDWDGDVDQTDFGIFQACQTGAAIHQTDPACSRAWLDGDMDVDKDDITLFHQCLSGPQVPADPNCTQ